ncbi:hypothetical protein BCR44DRAFT_81157 [Catenaria anguillulae PL171]|uniref:Letm1 RBD domain-containing protein n=1 Tax=Catenaria anguillulae PL171 TaxID=765915 RepID=A0A1Y2HD49_9FUNG|nr:hypothetical protein BCR44DRAFT_81157 [Catenaria anguillulae PL171]
MYSIPVRATKMMILANTFGSTARRILAVSTPAAARFVPAFAQPSSDSFSAAWSVHHREYSSKGQSGPPKQKLAKVRRSPGSRVTPPVSSSATVSVPVAAATPTAVPQAPSQTSPSSVSTPAAAPAHRLVEKARAFFAKYKEGLRVLIKQDIPRYRQLKAVPESELSRRDAVFVERVRHDIKILAPFGLFLIVLPEIIPLLVLKGLVPSTCIDRDDRAKAWTKRMAVREVTAVRLWAALSGPKSHVNPAVLMSYDSVRSLALRDPTDFQMNLLQYQQHKFMLSYFGLSLYVPYPYPLGGRMSRYLVQLERDDHRIKNEPGSIKDMSDDELAMACELRGIPTVASPSSGAREPSRGQLERQLDLWVRMNTDKDIPKALVVFARIVQTAKMVRENGGNPKL